MSDNFSAQVNAAFVDVMHKFNDSPAIAFLRSNAFKAVHYRSALRTTGLSASRCQALRNRALNFMFKANRNITRPDALMRQLNLTF